MAFPKKSLFFRKPVAAGQSLINLPSTESYVIISFIEYKNKENRGKIFPFRGNECFDSGYWRNNR